MMAAPNAPVLHAHQDGHVLYARWEGVNGGAAYNVYVAEGLDPAVLAATVQAAAIGSDGWYFKIVGPYAGPVGITVTAVNAGDEESAVSNRVGRNLRGAGAEPTKGGKPS